jgi:hypothetical protein
MRDAATGRLGESRQASLREPHKATRKNYEPGSVRRKVDSDLTEWLAAPYRVESRKNKQR